MLFPTKIQPRGTQACAKCWAESGKECSCARHLPAITAYIRIGQNSFVNFGCVFLDCNLINIGEEAQIGPGVHIYTALHPTDAETRRGGLEAAKPVNIGRNVWIGGHSVICPGVTIGDDTVIGAGSVVVRDIPRGKIAVGNPCCVIRDAA